jgi:NitT/TauT family transport system permease protein
VILDRISPRASRRGAIAIVLFVVVWEIGSRSQSWISLPAFGWLRDGLEALGFRSSRLPWIGSVPSPSSVIKAWGTLIGDPAYWHSWYSSTQRVLLGFGAAMLLGVPIGLALAVNRTTFGVAFPVIELLRPIPPLAWVPAAIIFWPTQELSIAFVTFLGAFYTIVINVVGGARSIDLRYFQVARSMGASQWNVFRRIVLPATLPSIVVGSVVGMGITWEVVVAAEMISGGGQGSSAAGGGLGFLIWNSYVGGSYEQIVIGMISIGIAGLVSSALLRQLGQLLTPWERLR